MNKVMVTASTAIAVFVLCPILLAQTSMLDKTFGTNGSAIAFVGLGVNVGYSVAIQSDGKIVVAGVSNDVDTSGGYAFAVVRFDSNGSIDSTFGTNGTASTYISGGDSAEDRAYSVAIRTDGEIVVAGSSADTTGGQRHVAFALAQFNPDGTIDRTFGTNGTVRAFISGGEGLDVGYSVAIQPDGKIVVAGSSVFTYALYGFSVARFDSDGTIDNSFGTNGTAMFSISDGGGVLDVGNSVALQPDGKIVVAGYSIDASANYAFAVARLASNGTLDGTFGTNGSTRTLIDGGGIDDRGFSVAVQPDGKIVVAGFSEGPSTNHYAFAIARYDSNGILDNTFGTNGSTTTFISGGDSTNDWAYSVALQADGKIDATGFSAQASSNFAIAVARFNSNGTIDGTFGTHGSVSTLISSQDIDDEGHSVAIQSDGKIVVAGGSSGGAGGSAFAVVRYYPSAVSGIHGINSMAESFKLLQNYPNPFNPTTVIGYQLSAVSNVTLKVYDILGRVVATLVNEVQKIGSYEVQFDGSRLASGVYFYRLTAGDFVSVKKLVLVK